MMAVREKGHPLLCRLAAGDDLSPEVTKSGYGEEDLFTLELGMRHPVRASDRSIPLTILSLGEHGPPDVHVLLS